MAIINGRLTGVDELKRKLALIAEQQRNRADDAVLDVLQAEANDLIAHARTSGAYTDRTGNLRSSIGACIYFNGTLQRQIFNTDGTTAGRAQAVSALEQYAIDHPTEISTSGYTLVIVAGMNYARYVEAKGYNVLHLSVVKGQKDVQRISQRLNKQK
jgi:hypothetical protein